jgi:hypothetical protein
MIRIIKLSMPFVLALVMAGCATTSGQRFEQEKTTPADKAVIYVYREAGLVGAAVAYTVRVNGAEVAKLPAGGYFPYYATPGEVEFSAQTEAKTSVTIDAKAGQSYYIKGTIGVGVFVGHPHLVVVPNEIGAHEIIACALVPGVGARAAEGSGRPAVSTGPMATVVVDIAASDLVSSPPEPSDVRLEVVDRRAKIVMERTTIGHTPMSGVVLRPAETELVKAIVSAKLRESIAAQSSPTDLPGITCEITEFSITTPATILYWDVTADVKLTLRAGDQQRVLTGHAAKRTYAWPSGPLIKSAVLAALKAIVEQSGPALRDLLAATGTAAPAM